LADSHRSLFGLSTTNPTWIYYKSDLNSIGFLAYRIIVNSVESIISIQIEFPEILFLQPLIW
jgi:hypothetical protein